jgi:osmotically-inducible protein OsmY
VTATKGIVILEGIVATEAARAKIVAFAAGYKGVTRVDDRLRVMTTAPQGARLG